MKLIGYFFIFFGITGLTPNVPALLRYRRAIKSATEDYPQTDAAFGHLLKYHGVLVVLSMAALSLGIYITLNEPPLSSMAGGIPDQLWQLLTVYAIGFGITVEAAHRASTLTGRLVSTELEWQLGGILNTLYFALSIWLFIAVIQIIPWWALLPLMLFAVQFGVLLSELLQRRMGPLRGFLFLLSPTFLIWSAYMLWFL